jgi:hypothetical protein
MPIFRLTPIHLDAEAWQASTYTGEALVRAVDAQDARLLAARRFGKFIEVSPGEETFLDPWTQARLVTCTQESWSSYPEDGTHEVLWPEAEGGGLSRGGTQE